MDFFGIIYDMKNGKKVPYSKTYFDTLFAAKLGGSDVKTITGTLPLMFTTSETALRSWTIYGNNTQHNYSAEGTLPLTFSTHTAGAASDWEIEGNNDVGKNVIQLGESQSRNGVTLTIDSQAGTAIMNGNVTTTSGFSFNIFETSTLSAGSYIFSGGADGGSLTNYDLYLYNRSDQVIIGRLYNSSNTLTATIESGKQYTVYVQCRTGQVYNNIVFKPMLRPADTSSAFEPYQIGVGQRTANGYEIPLIITQTGQPDKTVDIYIGDSPLTEGETVSKTSTGVDIAAIAGSNTITTELYNKPSMSIEGVDYVGVGAVSGNKYLIRVINSANISPYNPNAPESDTNYVYNDSTHTLDTDSQFKTALISWQGGSGSFTITKTKGSTFKLESLKFLGKWGGEDQYMRTTVITPTDISYTGSTKGTHLLITYYDSEVDTLTPREIRESITVSASVTSMLDAPLLDAPLTEGETLTAESVGRDFTTFAGVENTIEPFNTEVYDYGDFEMSITYKEDN